MNKFTKKNKINKKQLENTDKKIFTQKEKKKST
jgi:hypothetical protein